VFAGTIRFNLDGLLFMEELAKQEKSNSVYCPFGNKGYYSEFILSKTEFLD